MAVAVHDAADDVRLARVQVPQLVGRVCSRVQVYEQAVPSTTGMRRYKLVDELTGLARVQGPHLVGRVCRRIQGHEEEVLSTTGNMHK